MDPILHTLVAMAALAAAYYGGTFVARRTVSEYAFDRILRKWNEDGFVAITVDDDGDYALMPIREIVETVATDIRRGDGEIVDKLLTNLGD